MSADAIDLGEVQTLGKALGLIDGSDNFRSDWLSDPGHYLSSVLADETQRNSLVRFIDEALGGEGRETDPDGLIWLPIATNAAPHVTVYAVLDPTPADFIGIGIGARVTTTATAESKTSVHVPVFRAAKSGHTVADPILIGHSPNAAVRLETEITIGNTPPLGGLALKLRVPTQGGTPRFELSLKRLQLPGASQASDLNLSASNLAELETSALELVLGLVRAAADTAAAPQLTAVVGMLGLSSGGAIPSLPIEALKSQGARALSAWFESVMSTPAARTAWLGNVATLLGGAAAGGEVGFNLGPARVAFGVQVRAGAGGHSIVTPTLAASITQGDFRARAEADLLDLDLATFSARALPRLDLFAQVGKRADGGTRLLSGDPQVDCVRVGLTLDGNRRPNFLLAVDGVVIAGRTYASLDLSSPDSLAQVAGTVLSQVVNDLLAGLGPIGAVIGMLAGVTAPPSAPGATLLNVATFLHDPLGAVGEYWRGLLHDHPTAVKDLLAALRDLLAEATHAGTAIVGSGSEADPWRMPIAGPFGLDVSIASGGDVLKVGVSAAYSAATLGQRCTRVDSSLSVGLVRLDLAQGTAVFLQSIDAKLTARARLVSQAVLTIGPLALTADFIGIAGSWRPSSGLSFNILAPNLAARVGDANVPLTLPVLGPGGVPALDAAGWDLLERFIGLLASAAPVEWIPQLAAALGWIPDLAAGRPRLRLADVATNATVAIKNWLIALALDDSGRIQNGLESLARMVTGGSGLAGLFEGSGTAEDPYRVPILPAEGWPELAVWLVPDGPDRPVSFVPDPLTSWRPGSTGLAPRQLADALADEAGAASDVNGLVSGRPDLVAGFSTLETRWTGSDGRIVPPATDPAGITVHRLDNVTWDQLAASVNVAQTLGGAAATIVRVAVVAAGSPLPFGGAPAGRVLDLRGAGRTPESFAQPTGATGEWFIALAERADARLASGDTDGIAGQAARLARVLAPFSSIAGGLVLVAQDAAGHAALAAANALSFVKAVITLGTPFTPVAFAVLDEQPGADAFRLLRVLLPPLDAGETDDADLACGRGMVSGLAALLPEGDPGVELRPPAVPLVPRAGLAVHAFFGVLDQDAVLRGMTAIVAASLSARAVARAAHPRRPVAGVRCGLRIPVAPGASGITVSGNAVLELFACDMTGGGPVVSTERSIDVHLELRRVNGWLAGGPGAGLGVGPRPQREVRWLESNLRIPFGGGETTSEIVLHEPEIFGIVRERWILRTGGGVVPSGDVVTPALPEIRVLISLLAEQLNLAAGSSPAVDAAIALLRGLDILGATSGSVPDAIDHLLHDAAAHIDGALTDAAKLTGISAAVNTLLTGIPGLTIDLAHRRLVFDAAGTPGSRGMLPWTAHVEATASEPLIARLTLGSAGTTAAGGGVLRVETGPLRVNLDWQRPGRPTPDAVALWPTPDGAGIGRVLARLVPAECARIGLEYLRNLDDTARPIIDLALDAVGLLGPVIEERRAVLLPAGLLHDPVGWLSHESALGGAGGFNAAKAAALIDALKPILGMSGNPGEWNLASGVTAVADSAGGNLRLGVRVATSGLAPIPTASGRLVASGTFTLTLPAGQAPQPGVTLSLGIAGAAPGKRAAYIEIAPTLRVYLRPATGADLALYPDPPGLGELAGAAVSRALPFILDRLAALTGATLQGKVGAVVRAVGDGLNLRTGGQFDPAKLQAWAADPVGSLAAALPTLTSTALGAIATALTPALPAGVSVTAASGNITVTAGSLNVTWQPSPLQFTCTGSITGIPGVTRVDIGIVVDATGLRSAAAQLGPATINAGGVTLRPFVAARAGQSPAGGRRIQFGLALDAAGAHLVGGRWSLDGAGFALVKIDGAAEDTNLEHVALAMLQAVLDLVASFAIRTTALQHLLDNHVGSTTVREVMRGIVLQDVPAPTNLDANLFDPTRLLGRVQRLAVNLAGANPMINIGDGLSIGLSKAGNIIQLTLGVNGRVPLTTGDLVVSVEADSRWIQGQPAAGIAIGVLDAAAMAFAPSLAANGLGLRISKESGPLFNIGVSLGSVAVHLYGEVTASGTLSGGAQLQLSDLAVAPASAQGGNPIARGLMGDGGSGQNQLRPAFSPALAVQKHGGGPVLVSLRAGDGDGPWWLVIQKGFGPIYIEQVGFGVTVRQDQIQKISVLLDGRVSVFGLTAAVDDLQVTFLVASNASLFDPSRYVFDLAGLAINAEIAGVTLAGGLRKFGEGDNIEYVGMLLGRFAVYGLSVYGGYGSAVVNGQRFSSFFAFGAVNGPIGGPPAFFLTGIGGGLGINRDLIFPSDLSTFGQFPFIKALDPAARPSSDPMAELASLRNYFPMKRGEFWFAAGISFNSFALVDGIAVVSVKIGDGLEIALLGLARMALPRPEFALVSIELGLIARFSTREGVLWVQAQLTDNSWLLYPDVRLTGGFAFVTWFKGPNKGQFVLTIGGYHPHFHHDGYPIVPRLGFHWNVSRAIVIKGEAYFALTSEAVMAGGQLTASAHFGPAWAEVVFGANGIVYFDPFRFEVEVYARISAGVTIDLWIGEVTIRVSMGSRIKIAGPKFHGVAEFDVGPVTIRVPFGDASQSQKVFLAWDQFVRKYLEEASPGVARVLTATPGKGALPPGPRSGGGTDTAAADGSPDRPFEVISEFEITVTTTVPTQRLNFSRSPGAIPAETNHPPSSLLGVAPVGVNAANTRLSLTLLDAGNVDRLGALPADVHIGGSFPVGVWGPPQPDDDRKVPTGDVIQAVDSVRFEAKASLQGTLPGQIAYNRIDPPGPRKPLPFVSIQAERTSVLNTAKGLSDLLPPASGGPATFTVAKPWLAKGGNSNTAVAAIERERKAPPRLGSLTQDMAKAESPTPPVQFPTAPGPTPIDFTIHPPKAVAVLTASVLPERPQARTTVKDRTITRVAAPAMDDVRAQLPQAVAAKLVRVAAPAEKQATTLVPAGTTPLTRVARGPVAAVAARSASADSKARLDALTGRLSGAALPTAAPADPAAQELRAGEIAVLQLPNALRDVNPDAARPMLMVSGRSRVVAFSHGGTVLSDAPGSPNGTPVPMGTERLAVVALNDTPGIGGGLAGWHSGQESAYVGWSSALVTGAVVRAEGASVPVTRERFRAGWIQTADLVTGTNIVVTRFVGPPLTIVIVIDDPAGADVARGLSLGLEGAERLLGPDGQPVPPTVVVAANRSFLIYPLASRFVPTPVPIPRPVTVSVASEDGWHLAGVLAGNDSPQALAERVTKNGLDSLVEPLIGSRGSSVQLQWARPTPPPGGSRKNPPAKKPPAKKAAKAGGRKRRSK